MNISEKQLILLLRVLEGSLTICDRTDRNIFGWNQDVRLKTYNEIINQQDAPVQQTTGPRCQCQDCGIEINECEHKIFGVCDACWDKAHKK